MKCNREVAEDEKQHRRSRRQEICCLLVACLTSQQHASVSQGRICSNNLTGCHTEIEVADQKFYLTQSQYTDTGPTSPSADPITPGAWQGSHWNCQFLSHWYDSTPKKKSRRKRDSNPGPSALETDALPLGQRGGNLREPTTQIKTIQSKQKKRKMRHTFGSFQQQRNRISGTHLHGQFYVLPN